MIGRVNGVNFTCLYGGTTAMGWKTIKLPPGHTWKSYYEFLLSTMDAKTAAHYNGILEKSKKYWTKGGTVDPGTADEVLAAYPHRVLEPSDDQFGLGVLSKYPIASAEKVPAADVLATLKLRLVLEPVMVDKLLDAAFSILRHASCDNASVLLHMLTTIEQISQEAAVPAARAALMRHVQLIAAESTAGALIVEDRQRIQQLCEAILQSASPNADRQVAG